MTIQYNNTIQLIDWLVGMNQNKPVQLSQKVQFLHQKIDFMHTQVKHSGLFELKMKFIQFIDTSIQKVVHLDNKNKYSSEVVQRKYDQYYNAEENQRQKNRIEQQKKVLSNRIAQLAEKEKNIEIQSLRLQIQNGRILKQKMSQQYSHREAELKEYTFELQKKLKSVQKELQKVVKMNSAQAKEIQILKQQRNKAQKRQIQWRYKYDNEIGILQTFSNKKSKYVFRDEQGLRIYRNITNATNAAKGCERLLLCDIPLKFHVLKIVYGIKVGHMLASREVQYFKQISLYQKQEMVLTIENGYLRLEYVKRKVIVNLDKYELVNKNQIIIMLFGKGDSIAIDQSK